MNEGLVFLCCFCTLIAVGSAAFVAIVSATIFYKYQVELKRQLASLPLKADHAINNAVSKYIEPLKQYKDGTKEPLNPNLILPSEENREFADWLIGD